MTKHPKSQVLHALAEGIVVQWQNASWEGTTPGAWVDYEPTNRDHPNVFKPEDHIRWRVKPARHFVRIMKLGGHKTFGDYLTQMVRACENATTGFLNCPREEAENEAKAGNFGPFDGWVTEWIEVFE